MLVELSWVGVSASCSVTRETTACPGSGWSKTSSIRQRWELELTTTLLAHRCQRQCVLEQASGSRYAPSPRYCPVPPRCYGPPIHPSCANKFKQRFHLNLDYSTLYKTLSALLLATKNAPSLLHPHHQHLQPKQLGCAICWKRVDAVPYCSITEEDEDEEFRNIGICKLA